MHIGAVIKRNAMVALLAVTGGYLGGVLHDIQSRNRTTIRAERFEVIEPSGRVASYWGPDADPQIPNTTPHGTLLVFIDSQGVRRCQIGSRVGDHGPELLFYDTDGPTDKPGPSNAQPRVSINLGGTGSPTLHMRGRDGDRMALGAMYGDVSGERELGWGLSFRAWAVPARADIGYSRWLDGGYQSSVALTNGADKHWEEVVGEKLKPLPLMRRPHR